MLIRHASSGLPLLLEAVGAGVLVLLLDVLATARAALVHNLKLVLLLMVRTLVALLPDAELRVK